MIGDTSIIYMDGDRLMLEWRGWQSPGESGGQGVRCGGMVDLTTHIEGIVRKVLGEQTKTE